MDTIYVEPNPKVSPGADDMAGIASDADGIWPRKRTSSHGASEHLMPAEAV